MDGLDLASLVAYPNRAAHLDDVSLEVAETQLKARVQTFEHSFRQQHRRPARSQELAPVVAEIKALVAVSTVRKQRAKLESARSTVEEVSPASRTDEPAHQPAEAERGSHDAEVQRRAAEARTSPRPRPSSRLS
jgi:hypothetical protein